MKQLKEHYVFLTLTTYRHKGTKSWMSTTIILPFMVIYKSNFRTSLTITNDPPTRNKGTLKNITAISLKEQHKSIFVAKITMGFK